MGSDVQIARRGLGIMDCDMTKIEKDAKRRRMATILLGGVGTVAAVIAGFVAARSLYDELPDNYTSGTYPFIPLMAAVGVVPRARRVTVVGAVASIVTGFVVMFLITAAPHFMEPSPVPMYGVLSRDCAEVA